MELSAEELTELEALGAAFMSMADCAILLEKDEYALREEMANTFTAAHKAYHKGRLTSVVATRKAIVKQAADGSAPAQALAMELIRKIDMDHA